MCEHVYWLMYTGHEVAEQLLAADQPVFGWYAERAELVARVAGDAGGDALKQVRRPGGAPLTLRATGPRRAERGSPR